MIYLKVSVVALLTLQSLAFTNRQRGQDQVRSRAAQETLRATAKDENGQDTRKSSGESRRSFFATSFQSLLLTSSSFVACNHQAAQASEVRAPLELLRPAARVKLYIDNAVILCQSAKTDSSALVTLKVFFDNEPTSFLTPEEEKLSRRYLEIDTSTAWQKARNKERDERAAELGMDYTTLDNQVNMALQQWGNKRQFKILRKRRLALDEAKPIRKALNAYTNNLVFGDAYQLNLQGDEKKALIRNDALPTVNAVVVSDLDLRDLYRNQVLENMDDAKAELNYQLKSGDINVDEILVFLQQAQSSCNEWFSFIPKGDVEEALKEVSV